MNQIAQLASPVFGASKDATDFALKVFGVVGFAALTAAAAQASIPVAGTPIPMTLQTLAVTLCALTMGPRLGAMSMLLYLGAAAAGAPVLAESSGGWASVIGASGGYLIGFVLAQPVMALAARNGKAFGGAKGLIASLVLGNVVVFTCGVLWLALYMKEGWSEALADGLWPFLPGTVIKSAAAFILGFGLVPWSIKRGW